MTVLRSLMIELGMTDNVSNRLLGIDNQINRLDSGVIDTQSNFTELERATKNYSDTAGKGVENVTKDVDRLNKEIDKNADVTQKAADTAKRSWGEVAMIGAAMTAAGAAGTYLVVSNAKQAAEFESMSANFRKNLGENADTMLEEMDRAAAGTISSFDQIKQANYAMTMGIDAETIPAMMEAARAASRRFGGDISYYYQSIVTGTARQSKLILDNLGIIVDANTAYETYAKSVKKSVTALTDEERSLAFQQEVMRQSQIMVEETDMTYGEYGDTLARISVIQGELSREIAGSTIPIQSGFLGVLEGTLDAFKNAPGPIKATVGTFALLTSGGLAMAGPLLTSAASAATLYSNISNTKLITSLITSTKAVWAFTASLLANPLTWVIVGIVALGAALYLLASNWDAISDWFMGKWEDCGESITGVTEWISEAWDATVGRLVAGAEWLVDSMGILAFLFPITAPIAAMRLLADNWDTVTASIGGGWNWLTNAAQNGVNWLSETIDNGLSAVIDLFWQYHPIGILIRQWDEITEYLGNIDLVQIGRDIIRGLVNGIIGEQNPVFEAVIGIGETIIGGFKDFFGIRSPSKLMQETGIAIGDGLTIGLEQSVPTNIPMPEPTTSTGVFQFDTIVEDPSIPAPIGGEYQIEAVRPEIMELTGAITYLSTVIKPVVSALTGNLTYESRVSEPMIADRAGTVVYEPEVSEPTISALTSAITYVASVLDPFIPLLTGVVTYLSEVLRPEVPALAGTIEYGTTLPGPEVPTLTGDLVYEPEVSEPTVSDLTGAITYLAKVIEPVISALKGELTYETRVSEPTIIDRNGTVVYENEVSEPTISALTGAITYVASVLEPFIKPLMGYVQYESKVTEPKISDFAADITYLSTVNEPNITALERNVLYRDQPPETPIPDGMTVKYDTEIIEPELAGLTGAITYLSEIIKPIVETLEGIIEYRGIITEPIIPEHISRGYDIPEKQIEFESPDQDAAVQRYDYRPENDTVSTHQSVYSTFAPSTTIHITASGNDAQTIATAVDRRLRQTFDQHAETYFARQIRRKGQKRLGSNI